MTALPSSSRARTVWIVIGGAAAITLGAWLSVPMTPVPMTLQSLAVVVLGALVARSLALAAIALYVAAALAGLPVLASFESAPGAEFFAWKTNGYVFGFFAAALVARNMNPTRSPPAAFAWAVLAHAAILACGVARLAFSLGLEAAIERGFTPFVLGALVKSALAVLIVRWTPRI
jgi:biotin transport system substrate-specific component